MDGSILTALSSVTAIRLMHARWHSLRLINLAVGKAVESASFACFSSQFALDRIELLLPFTVRLCIHPVFPLSVANHGNSARIEGQVRRRERLRFFAPSPRKPSGREVVLPICVNLRHLRI